MVKDREVNYLAFLFYSWWIQNGRSWPAASLAGSDSEWHPTVYTTQAEYNKRGAPFSRACMRKRGPLDHSNYSIYITQWHSGTWRTHQTLLFTQALAANEAHWISLCFPFTHVLWPACQQQLSAPDRLSLSEPFIPFSTFDPKGYDISSPDLWSFLLADIQLLFPVFNSASLFLAKLIGSNRHLPKDYKVSQGFHKEASDLAIKSPIATIYANNNE